MIRYFPVERIVLEGISLFLFRGKQAVTGLSHLSAGAPLCEHMKKMVNFA